LSQIVGQRPAVTKDLSETLHLWKKAEASGHFVQFYENDAFLLASLSDYIAAGLEVNESAIVVATRSHTRELDDLLANRGFDLESLRTTGKYSTIDAAETLARFMVNGHPDAERFVDAFVPLIEGAIRNGGRLRIYGEMVALLWADGNQQAAIRLEQMWNELQNRAAFLLLCAYPVQSFDPALIKPIEIMCATHSGILPMENGSVNLHGSDSVRAIIGLQHKSKLLEAEIERRKQVEEELLDSQRNLTIFLRMLRMGFTALQQMAPSFGPTKRNSICWVTRKKNISVTTFPSSMRIQPSATIFSTAFNAMKRFAISKPASDGKMALSG